MMDDDKPTVDWSLLPHSPQAFFGVEDGFDRRDLKRQYNRLIRMYKPEQHPEEFQRIRAAYEQLDNGLRYGTSATGSFLDGAAAGPAGAEFGAYRWMTEVPDSEAGAQSRSVPAPKRRTLLERVQSEPLPELYKQVAGKENKTPFEYYSLAILSDVMQTAKGEGFAEWILRGLRAHPGDLGLTALLAEYLRGPVPGGSLPALLVATAKVVPSERFFGMTEPAWRRMLKEHPFPAFRKTLERCVGHLKGLSIDGQIVFLIEIFKAAVWVADPDWVEESIHLINNNYERVPHHLQWDVDLIDILGRYVAGRPRFAEGPAVLQRIDRAVRDYFAEEQEAGDRSVLECQTSLAQDPQGVLEAFPSEGDEFLSNFYMLWNYLSADVAERHLDSGIERPNLDMWSTRGSALFSQIDRAIDGSMLGRRWGLMRNGYRLLVGVFYFVIIFFLTVILTMLTIELPGVYGSLLVLTFAIGGGLLLSRWAHLRWLYPRWERYAGRMEDQAYEKFGRPELIGFLQRSRFHFDELTSLLLQSTISTRSHAQETFNRCQQDFGLGVFALAVDFEG